MKTLILKMLVLLVSGSVLMAIPYFAGNWTWLTVSWAPALLTFYYLDDAVDTVLSQPEK
jgi:hypothetical protein